MTRRRSRRGIRIACIYKLNPDPGEGLGRGLGVSMDVIRFYRMAEALARAGYDVDVVHRRVPATRHAPGLRTVRLRSVRWDRYDVIKTSIHNGFANLVKHGGGEHPLIVASLGSVVGRDARPGVHFFGKAHEDLIEIQEDIARRARAVNILTDENERIWVETHGPEMLRLRVPTGVDRILPPPGPDPFRRYGATGRGVLFAGNVYEDVQQEVNQLWVDRLNRLGRALQKRGLQLFAMGAGDVSRIDRSAVTHLGGVSADDVWDWQRHAVAGVVLAHGPVQDNESSKIYYYLRTELPTICESPVPNRWLVEQTGHGAIVPLDDVEEMAEAAASFAGRRRRPNGLGEWMATAHSWDERATRYESLFEEAAMRPDRARRARATPGPARGSIVLLSPGLGEKMVWGERIVFRGLGRALERTFPGARVEMLDVTQIDLLADMRVDLLVSVCTGPRHPWRADDIGTRIDGISLLWVLNHPHLLDEFANVQVDGFLSNSRLAAARLGQSRPSAWCPLGVDRDWQPQPAQARYRAEVVYLGSGGRGNKRPATTHHFLDAAKRFDFGLWGSNWSHEYWAPVHLADSDANDWHRYWRGPLAVGEEAALYGSAGVALGYHEDGQRDWGMWNNRVFEALASAVPFISDAAAGLADELGDGLLLTTGGDETAEHIARVLHSPAQFRHMADIGRQMVMSRFTYDHAAERLAQHYVELCELRGVVPMKTALAPRRLRQAS